MLETTGFEATNEKGEAVVVENDVKQEESNVNSEERQSRWVWLRNMWQEERRVSDSGHHTRPPWTRKRKQSIVDPFLKRFSTRELQQADLRPSTPSNITSETHREQLIKQDTDLEPDDLPLKHFNNHIDSRNQHHNDFIHSGVINPKGAFIFYWNYLLAFTIFYHLWTIIFRVAFLEGNGVSGNEIPFLVFDYIIDVVFILDIIISSRISFLQNGILVRNVKKVAFTYLFTRTFFVDVFSVLPIDFLYIALGVTPTLRLVRLIKVYRLFKIKTDVESMSSFPALLRASLLVHSMLLLIHWNACFYFMISQSEGFGTNDWVYPSMNGSFVGLSRKYARSFYWSTLTLTAIGDLPAPETNVEYLYTICCYLCGVFMFATVVGNIGSIILNRNSNKIMFEQHRDEARNYMEERRVPKELQERVLLWYDYAFQRGRINGVDDLNSLSLLPDKMKTELAIHIHLDTLKKVSFLQKCQPEFLHDLLLKMKLIIYTPGDLIIRRGEIAREMYLISDGIVQIIGESGNLLKELGTGDFFGEIGILNLSGGQNRRIADVRSLGYTECFMLLREDVLAATRDYPEAQAILSAYGRERLKKTRKTSKPAKDLVTSSPPPARNGIVPEFELQVLRESVTSIGRENKGMIVEENEVGEGKVSSRGSTTSRGRINSRGMICVNVSPPRISNASTKSNPSKDSDKRKELEEKLNANYEELAQLKQTVEFKDKELALFNDVIKSLQGEKEIHASETAKLRTELHNAGQKIWEFEEENTKLKCLNETQEELIKNLRRQVQKHRQKTIEKDVVVTEVNECEESC